MSLNQLIKFVFAVHNINIMDLSKKKESKTRLREKSMPFHEVESEEQEMRKLYMST